MKNVSEIGIEIVVTDFGEGEAKCLVVGGVVQSAVFTDEERRYEPVLSYSKKVMRVLDENFFDGKRSPSDNEREVRVLMLGGGGFDIPRMLLHRHDNVLMDVVEYSGEVLELARNEFRLDELTAGGRLSVYNEDAFSHLSSSKKKYDLIINDVFVANVPPMEGLTDGTVGLVKEHLAEGGLYVLNMISALEGPASMPMQLETRILMRFFERVRAYPCMNDNGPEELHNIIFSCFD